VQEEKSTKAAKEVFILEGLDCANCAMKIENKVKEMPTVSTATVDFVSKKLRVEVANKRELEATVANITNVVQKLEPDVKVVREEKGGHDHGHSHDHGEANVKKMVGRL
ncbi:cation transporter, partial [Vibrio cholerae]|nr:cation transporter [Vibrio cholerae]